MTKHVAPLPVPDGSLVLRELNRGVNNELTSTICKISAKAAESDDVAVKAALSDVVDLLRGYADVHKTPHMSRSSSSWEMTVPQKELNMQVVGNGGGLFTGDR
jgi:hypothetical protein